MTFRHGHLWQEIISFENLLQAARQAQRGKRYRDNVLRFNDNLEQELIKLQMQLENRSYLPGAYRTFQVLDPKPRQISAAPYRDRVVHHALCNIIVPIIERTFIHDTYANRLGFGTHRALQRFTTFARSNRYILQCDIRKYFPSIDHSILKTILRHKIKCIDTLWLIDSIIDASNPQELALDYFAGDDLLSPIQRRQGLPIGNLTSQFFANVYLSGFDHFVKEKLAVKQYLRYVDDFSAFSNDREFLTDIQLAMSDFLDTLRLKLHPLKSQLFETRLGANFVGFRILPNRIRVRNDNLRRARRRLRQLQQDYALGAISLPDLTQRLQSWEAHLKHGDTYQLRQKVFEQLIFTRSNPTV